jgi:hypothetical protein
MCDVPLSGHDLDVFEEVWGDLEVYRVCVDHDEDPDCDIPVDPRMTDHVDYILDFVFIGGFNDKE